MECLLQNDKCRVGLSDSSNEKTAFIINVNTVNLPNNMFMHN